MFTVFRQGMKQSGQAIVMIAFFLVVIISGVGLALDGGNAYFVSTEADRAAAAGALAGVVYMPGASGPATGGPPNGCGGTVDGTVVMPRVMAAVNANGFDPSQNPADSVTACVVYTQTGAMLTNRLQVQVTRRVPSYFLGIVGISTFTITRTETAARKASVSLGQPGYQQGPTAECFDNTTDPNCKNPNGSPKYPYSFVIKGWHNAREHGEPFGPNDCYNFRAGPPGPCSTDRHLVSDSDAAGMSVGLPARGGYNWIITIPPGGGTIWVYNAIHGPSWNSGAPPDTCDNNPVTGFVGNCTPSGATFREDDGGGGLPSAAAPGGENDVKSYSKAVFTLFFDGQYPAPGTDIPITQMSLNPVDATHLNMTNTGKYYVPQAGGGWATWPTINQAMGAVPYYHWWTRPDQPDASTTLDSSGRPLVSFNRLRSSVATGSLGNGLDLPQGVYRLRVDALNWDGTFPGTNPGSDGWYQKVYSVAVGPPGATAATGNPSCTNPAPPLTSNCSGAANVHALNDMTIDVPGINHSIGGLSQDFYLPVFQLPAEARGATVEINMFDPGDLSGGNTYMTLSPPDNTLPLPNVRMYDTGINVALGTAQVPVTACAPFAGGGADRDNDPRAPCTIGLTGNQGDRRNLAPSPLPAPENGEDLSVQTGGAGGADVWYNGHWLRMAVPIPATYDPASAGGTSPLRGSGFWSLVYTSTATGGRDTLAFQVTLEGTPAHLCLGGTSGNC